MTNTKFVQNCYYVCSRLKVSLHVASGEAKEAHKLPDMIFRKAIIVYRQVEFKVKGNPTINAKSLACDTENEHALTCTRETCSCSQKSVQWNQWR